MLQFEQNIKCGLYGVCSPKCMEPSVPLGAVPTGVTASEAPCASEIFLHEQECSAPSVHVGYR